MGAEAVKNFRRCSSRENRPLAVGTWWGAGAIETTTAKGMVDITTPLRQRCFTDGDTPKARGIAWAGQPWRDYQYRSTRLSILLPGRVGRQGGGVAS